MSEQIIHAIETHAQPYGSDIESAPDTINQTEWQEPILFGEIEVPNIPTTLLPAWLGTYTDAVSKATQTPSAMAVMLVLSVLATCLQKKIEVCPYGDEYTEPLNIWTLTAMPPASRKTAVMNHLTAPLHQWEKAEAQRLAGEIAEAEAKQKILTKRINELENRAARTDDASEREALTKEIAELKEQVKTCPAFPRLWTGDVTPERLQNLLVEQGEKMSVLSDEGGIFEVMAGLYSDGKINVDIFLKSHAGGAARTDRASREAHLEKPALTFGLVIQPDIISQLAQGSKRRFRGNGCLARFLYCLPKSNIGKRDVTKRMPIAADIKASYEHGINQLLSMKGNIDGSPILLHLSRDAKQSWEKFAAYIESRQGDGKDLEPIQDWSGKLPGASLRIAGLLHVAEHGINNLVIARATIESALDLCELLVAHAQACFDLMGNDPAVDDAKYIFRWLKSKKKATFKETEVFQTGRFKNSKKDRLLSALDILHGRHMISDQQRRKTETTAGLTSKPTLIREVNPEIFEEK